MRNKNINRYLPMRIFSWFSCFSTIYIYIYIYIVEKQENQEKIIYIYKQVHGLVGSVFRNSPGDLGSIPGRIISRTFKMVLDTSLLNTQQYIVRIKGQVEQSWE